MSSSVQESMEATSAVARVTAACPRCMAGLYRSYPDEPLACILCGYEKYPEAGKLLVEREQELLRRRQSIRGGEPQPSYKTQAGRRTWEGAVLWKGERQSIIVDYIKDRDRAFIIEVSGRFANHLHETHTRKGSVVKRKASSVLIEAFNIGTGLRLCYVDTWVKENVKK